MDLQLKGRTAIITGGSRGIGKAIAREFAAEGMDVVIVARDAASNGAAAAEIARATGRKIVALQADTGNDESVKAMVAAALAALGRVDVLVNGAAQPGGQAAPPTLGEITNDHFWADMNVKVLGYLRTAREVAPIMTKQGGGRIINISGLAARGTGSTIGSMRNVSVAALTKNLADELSAKKIGVVCVHPGLTWTEKTPGVIEGRAKSQGVSPAEVEARMTAGNLLGRIVTSEEVAHLVTFLASPLSAAINGDAIAAGGGSRGSIHY